MSTSGRVLPHVEPERRYGLVKSCMDTIAEIWAAGAANDELKTTLVDTADQYVGTLVLSYI